MGITMNESLKIFTPEKLITWLENGDCPIGTTEEVAIQLRKRLKVLQDYWDINHADRRCVVCHGIGEQFTHHGMVEGCAEPVITSEECDNCLGKGTVRV